ncbi:DMSO/TMAO reductase YedYZ molybdopterin-dependent catalytic subunit [Luteibacter rhizovicinus]|uniref:DMSO/TMAO reductase YedYZ molybdopterin-dependent catalytic subunit n=1 Tax=Luteibacter rhizovicinus TaxID=242606 RepID=A0A4R3YXV7_9GAMM|nr:sulfite oxidase-like oxidoreductase [Luteibacter rhizovicinus]TCV97470.1 DMSO/TMAO reductase YedYZ molybdopterin-dependent catalytic subunit [Luteibacter rhizovicinus]
MSSNDPQERPDSKLTRSKQEWAREGKFLTGRHARPDSERLPPGQHLVQNWPVLDLGVQPDVPLNVWHLEIDGAVEEEACWNWASFSRQPQTDLTSDIHCVTTWSRYDNHWQGVATRDFLETVRPRAEARHVVLHSYDGYTTNVTMEDFAAEGALLAHSWEGKPLSREHGGPVRLIIPHLYLWKSAKWVRRIEFRVDNEPGFWEVRGYNNHADPWLEERYS